MFDGHIPITKNFSSSIKWVKTGKYVYVVPEDALKGMIEIDFNLVNDVRI